MNPNPIFNQQTSIIVAYPTDKVNCLIKQEVLQGKMKEGVIVMQHLPKIDRRIQRTRQLLMQGAQEVVQEKGFAATTIQDITDRANVNRATFYAHFTDKYALADAIIRQQFQQLLVTKLPPESTWERDTLHLLIQTVIELYGGCHPEEMLSQLIEKAIKEELTVILIVWLKQQKKDGTPWRVPIETVAQLIVWVILGAADQWSRTKITQSPEQITNDVLLILTEGVTKLILEGREGVTCSSES